MTPDEKMDAALEYDSRWRIALAAAKKGKPVERDRQWRAAIAATQHACAVTGNQVCVADALLKYMRDHHDLR